MNKSKKHSRNRFTHSKLSFPWRHRNGLKVLQPLCCCLPMGKNGRLKLIALIGSKQIKNDSIPILVENSTFFVWLKTMTFCIRLKTAEWQRFSSHYFSYWGLFGPGSCLGVLPYIGSMDSKYHSGNGLPHCVGFAPYHYIWLVKSNKR